MAGLHNTLRLIKEFDIDHRNILAYVKGKDFSDHHLCVTNYSVVCWVLVVLNALAAT